MNDESKTTGEAVKGAALGAAIAGAAIGAGAVFLANKENREKIKDLAKKSSKEMKKLRSKPIDQIISDVKQQVSRKTTEEA